MLLLDRDACSVFGDSLISANLKANQSVAEELATRLDQPRVNVWVSELDLFTKPNVLPAQDDERANVLLVDNVRNGVFEFRSEIHQVFDV